VVEVQADSGPLGRHPGARDEVRQHLFELFELLWSETRKIELV
jgi:hypothetical protein